MKTPTLSILPLLVACATSTPSTPAPGAGADAHEHGAGHAQHGAGHAEHGAGHAEHGAGHAEHGAGHADPGAGHAAHADGHHGSGHAVGSAAHRFDDPERWAKVFDDPARDAWQKPAELVAALGIEPGSTVADVGAGTGYLAPHLARAVGAEGRVLLLDIEVSLVQHMSERIAREGLTGVEARLSSASAAALQPAEADLVILLDVAHHIEDRRAWFRALRDGVKPDGRVAIVDFKQGELPVGPPPDHRLPAEQLTAELAGVGWRLVDSPEVLPHQYVRIYAKAE